MPEKDEVLLYLVVALGVLLVINAKRLWELLYAGVSLDELIQTNDVSWQVQSFLYSVEAAIDPRLADFTVWMIIGILSVVTIIFAQHVIEDTTQEIRLSQQMPTLELKAQATKDYVIKILVRLSGLALCIIWVRIFVGEVYNQLSQVFFESITSLPDVYSIIALPYTLVLTAIGIYTITICVRLIALKTRVLY